MIVEIEPDLPSLYRKAADRVCSAFTASVSERGVFSIALSGGSTPQGLFQLLAVPPYASSLPWASAQIFWGDERCVPPDDAQSNFRMARESLLSKVPIPADRVHRMKGELPPERAAAEYEKELRAFFGQDPRFDLVLLGLGSNGHTASLFPDRPVLKATHWVAADAPEDAPNPRLTLTYPVLNRARSVLFVVAGKDKRRALEATLKDRSTPAAGVKPQDGELAWLVDAEAGGTFRAGSY